MDVFLRIDINLIAIFLLGSVFLIAFKRLDKKDSLNWIYLTMTGIILILLSIETVTCIINKRPELWLIPITTFLHICLYSMGPVLTYFWYIFIKNFIIPEELYFKKKDIVIMIPVIINFIITLLSPIYDLTFYIDKANVYHRGPLFPVAASITYFYIVVGFVIIFVNRRNIIKQDYTPLAIFIILPLVGALIQTFYYGPLLMWSCTAFSLVLVYVFLQQRMVHLDNLTGAWDRGSFDSYINERLKRKKKESFGAIYVDVDKLKEINDKYGHLEGDFALKTSIKIIKGTIRKNDIVVRLGGDEFLLIVNCEKKEELNKTVDRLEMAFYQYNQYSGKKFNVNCSFGADIFDPSVTSIEQFINRVDKIMYHNKEVKKSKGQQSDAEIV